MIYLDHHSTTPCDDRVVQAMLPWLTESFGNPHSDHALGREAFQAIERSLETIAEAIHAPSESLIVTSGATEANNLAIRGVCLHPRQKKRHIVSVMSEHPAVLDVLADLHRDGFRVTLVPIHHVGNSDAGVVDLERLSAAIDDDTALVSVMWANNEIGVIAPMQQVACICHDRGTLLHSDATQALGRIPLDVIGADVDLVSFSAHKFYGPKGVGFLVAGNGNRRVRLRPEIVGGGQQRNLRSGTMPVPMIVAMATAVQIACQELASEGVRMRSLRDRLWNKLSERIDGLSLNGPKLESQARLAENLNFVVPQIEGEAWMSATPDVAFSTGSACSNAKAEPSHVLRSLSRSESEARQSVRFGVGRGNTPAEVDLAVERLVVSFEKLAGTATNASR